MHFCFLAAIVSTIKTTVELDMSPSQHLRMTTSQNEDKNEHQDERKTTRFHCPWQPTPGCLDL